MSKKIKISTNEQVSLRGKVKTEYARLMAISQDTDLTQKINDFKTKFTYCEILYKIVLEKYTEVKDGKTPDEKSLKLHMNQIETALNFAGYDYDAENLKFIFGSNEKVGERTAKKLRDALEHKRSKSAIKELNDRYDELNAYMDYFLNKINTFDNAA